MQWIGVPRKFCSAKSTCYLVTGWRDFLQPIIAEEIFFNRNRQQTSTPETQLE